MVWQRVLTFFSGADVFSVTWIVSAFMAGLGFGSLAGGALADRLSPRGRFAAFALAELGVAAFALVSLPLYHGFLYLRLGERGLSGPALGAVLFLTLLWPTFLMGLSLPLLARTLGPGGEGPEGWIGRLYGLNTLGAAAGALLSVFWLVRSYGFLGSVHAAAALNAACALLALVLARRAPGAADAPAAPPALARAAPPEAFGFPTWALLFGLSGFVALSLEIVWFRVLGVVQKSNAFTFATLLAVYLVGVGAGSLAGTRAARRSVRPARVFLAVQALIPACAVLALSAFLGLAPSLPAIWSHLGSYEPLDLGRALEALGKLARLGPLAAEDRALLWTGALLHGLVPALLLGPSTWLMGFAFPFLQKATQTDAGALGRRVGRLQAANILGCTLGAIVTGLALLSLLGTPGTLRLLTALSLAFVAALAGAGSGRGRVLLAGLPLLLALALCPGSDALWAGLHGARPAEVLQAENASGLSLLRDQALPGERRVTVVFAGGVGQSTLPYGDEHTLLGALPVLLHPAPRSVALVGLGSGDTLYGAAARRETERLDCIEIVGSQLLALRRLAETHDYAGLRLLLQDPRVRHVVGDGRAFLMRSRERYDVIEADALRPAAAFAGSLYSLEYFQLLRGRLRPGGYAVSWGPTARIRETFRRAFPHVLLLRQVLVGSDAPIVFDREALRTRLQAPYTREHFEHGAVDVEVLRRTCLEEQPTFFDRRGPAPADTDDLNTDLFPRDEYVVPRRR